MPTNPTAHTFRTRPAWRPLVLCVLWVASGLAPTPETRAQKGPISLGEALEWFAENNLELREARSRVIESFALARQASAYPNPSAAFTHEPLWRGDDDHSETYLNLSQRIEWPGLRSARAEAAEHLARVTEANLKVDSLRLAFVVARTYTRAIEAGLRQDIVEAAAEIYRRADRSNALMLAEGEVSGYHMRRLRVERARYENRVSEAMVEAQAARRRLVLLIAPESNIVEVVPSDDLLEISSNIALETVLQQARQHRPEIRSAEAGVDAAKAALMTARRERIPDPTFTAGFKRQSDDYKGLFLGASVSLPLFDRNQGTIEANQARIHAAEARLALVLARVDREVHQAHDSYTSLAGRVDLISDGLLREVDALLHAARVGYAEGEMSLIELLDATEAYSDARLASLRLQADLQIAYFDLLRAAGGQLGNSTFSTVH